MPTLPASRPSHVIDGLKYSSHSRIDISSFVLSAQYSANLLLIALPPLISGEISMSTSPVNSPIQRLNFDILWRIFDINADMFEDHRALKTTLATSRVYHSWRIFLLSSSSIWAHLIDLDHFLWNTVEGNREIIRRSGTALMWIKMHELVYRNSDLMNILNVVDANWTRIQRLEVHISVNHMNQWTPLLRPAPHLESCSLVFNPEYSEFEYQLPSYFGGDAPMLCDFRLEGQRFSFTPMSWLRQLRSLKFGGKLTVSQTLELLLSTVNLTNLWLEYKVDETVLTVLTLPFVSLPALAHLDLNLCGTLSPGAVLLEHLLIPPSCSVTILTQEIQRKEIDKKSNFEPFIGAISACAQRCFSHHPPQELLVVITPSSFLLEAAHLSNESSFTFSMNLQKNHAFPGQTLATMLGEFSLPGLCNVTSFAFRMTCILRPVPRLTTFLSCLPSVITISTEKLSLRHLRAYAPPKGGDTVPKIVFPALKTLKLSSFIPCKKERSQFDKARDPVSKYVMACISRGHAISVIDFTEETIDALPSMALLRKATGLKFLWKQSGISEIQEYICGISAPRNLVAVR